MSGHFTKVFAWLGDEPYVVAYWYGPVEMHDGAQEAGYYPAILGDE